MTLANQHHIFPIGKLIRVPVDIDGVESIVDFEFIEIVDDTDPSPSLMGNYWAFDNQVIINLKKRQMIF